MNSMVIEVHVYLSLNPSTYILDTVSHNKNII